MVRDKEKYEQAVQFRKRGFTYSEIARICDISKATVSNWLSKQSFSKQITKENTRRAASENKKRLQLLGKARTAERKTRYDEAVRAAETEFKHYKKDPRFIAGVIAYQCVGDLTDSSKIRLTSNRVEAHAVFIHFAVEYLGVAKNDVHFWLLFSGKVPLEQYTRFWSRQIGIKFVHFGKPQFVNTTQKSLHKGTGNTIIGSTVLKKKLMRWVELTSKEFKTK